MLKRVFWFVATIAAFCVFGMTVRADGAELENTIYLDLKDGRVVIELRDDLAPKHAARIRKLARAGFYDGLTFHRVIDGFMAQTGDPTGTGRGASDEPDLPAEFTKKAGFERGTIGMARSPHDFDSANSQFFICFAPAGWLNGQYTIVGKVAKGMEFVDRIARGEPPANPDVIVRMQVAADVK